MSSIIFTSAAWYAIPKGIKYLTTDCGTPSQSKMGRIRAKLFGCRHALKNLAYTNAFTKFFYEILEIPYARMWIAVLTAPVVKQVLPFKNPTDGLLQIAICYSLFSSKYFLQSFMKSSRGIECIASFWTLKILHTRAGLDFIKSLLSEDRWEASSFRQMRMVLELRLHPSDAYDFLRAKDKENLLNVVERVKNYKSDIEVKLLLTIVKNRHPERFGILEEDPLAHLPQKTREILLSLSNFGSDYSILDEAKGNRIFLQELFSCFSGVLKSLSNMPERIFPSLMESQYERLLPKLPDYPEDIHDTDPILSKIQCSLLLRPIRSAIVDPTNQQTIYDAGALEAYLKHDRASPMTRKEISTDFDLESSRGSKYDTVLRYRKACLRLGKLKEPKDFIANLKQVFAEISQLESVNHLKQASQEVCDFFQEGFLSAYDTRGLEYDDWTRDLARRTGVPHQKPYIYDFCKWEHNRALGARDEITNFGVRKWIRLPDEILGPEDFDQLGNRKPVESFAPTVENFDQYRFIKEEVEKEIQKIQTEQKDLIQTFS